MAEGDPAGRGVAEGEPAGREADGVGEGFVCTCTSAAKRVVPTASRVAAANDQNLNMTAYATQCSPFRKVNLTVKRELPFAREDRSLPHSALTALDRPI